MSMHRMHKVVLLENFELKLEHGELLLLVGHFLSDLTLFYDLQTFVYFN